MFNMCVSVAMLVCACVRGHVCVGMCAACGCAYMCAFEWLYAGGICTVWYLGFCVCKRLI